VATIRLKNITSGIAKVGALVRVHPTNKNAFEYVTDLTKLDVVGTIAQSGSPGSLCTVNLLNEGLTTTTPPNVIISPTPPTAPKIGMIWIQTSNN
jgi:hypothetical protein